MKLKEPLTTEVEDGAGLKDNTIFTRALGNAAAGRAFFIPRRFVQTRDTAGEIQEDTEVHVLVEAMRSFHERPPAKDGEDPSAMVTVPPAHLCNRRRTP